MKYKCRYVLRNLEIKTQNSNLFYRLGQNDIFVFSPHDYCFTFYYRSVTIRIRDQMTANVPNYLASIL